jgi:hypothetical protein
MIKGVENVSYSLEFQAIFCCCHSSKLGWLWHSVLISDFSFLMILGNEIKNKVFLGHYQKKDYNIYKEILGFSRFSPRN